MGCVQVGSCQLLRYVEISAVPVLCGGISFPFTPGSLQIVCPERAPGRDKRVQSLPLTFGFFPLLGYKYEGVKFEKGNCGVSIMRSGRQILVVE